MKKMVSIVFAMVTLFAFMAASPLCHAGQKKNNTNALQPAGDDSVIYGCYKKVNGQLRIVNSPENCRPSEESISWDKTGQEGGIDLADTYVKTCQNVSDCSCDNISWVLHGYAECPAGAVLASVGTPMGGADYGFHAKCIYLDGTNVEPASISISCVGMPPETNCSDGIDNDGDGAIDCADTDCAADPACQPVPVENCTDGIDNDTDGAIDCADTDCTADPACQQSAVSTENCSDGIDNDSDGAIDCKDEDCAIYSACKKKK